MQSFDRQGTCVGYCGPTKERIAIASVGHVDNRINGFLADRSDDRRRRSSIFGQRCGSGNTSGCAHGKSNQIGLTMYYVLLRGADAHQLRFITFVTRTFYDYFLRRLRRIQNRERKGSSHASEHGVIQWRFHPDGQSHGKSKRE